MCDLDRYYSSMVFSNSPGLNFDDLWMAFRPGDLLCQNIDGNINAMRLVSMRKSTGPRWLLTTLIASFDGTNFGYEQLSSEIQQYEGYVSLDQLPIFPLKYHSYSKDLRMELEQRGHKYVSLFGCHFREYSGIAKSIAQPDFHSSTSGSNKSQWRDVYVNGRIMIDFLGFNRNNPSCRIVLSDVTASTEQAQMGLPSDDYVICNNLLPGFDMHLKEWCLFNIDLVTKIDFNTAALDNLVLAPHMKEMVLCLVQSQMKSSPHIDIVRAKGRGIIFLLHGVPGVGKTLTAETAAEHYQKPLYSLTVGDIGLDSQSVEQSLNRIFALSKRWEALVLLDEADVFLAKRSASDLHRNALVSVFLRAIEYNEGILFLTTNQVETLDPAFKSRIHLSLYYGPLAPDSRAQIWSSLINKAVMEHPSWLDSDSLHRLASEELNGRQIKNVIKTALTLGKSCGRNFDMREIEGVLKVHRTSENNLNSVGRGTKRQAQDLDSSLIDGSPEAKKLRPDFSPTDETII